jgi:hypothetical protein
VAPRGCLARQVSVSWRRVDRSDGQDLQCAHFDPPGSTWLLFGGCRSRLWPGSSLQSTFSRGSRAPRSEEGGRSSMLIGKLPIVAEIGSAATILTGALGASLCPRDHATTDHLRSTWAVVGPPRRLPLRRQTSAIERIASPQCRLRAVAHPSRKSKRPYAWVQDNNAVLSPYFDAVLRR